jgi:multidrug efflux pump subunit AcrA (membrane-fusion protein)
LKLEAQIKHCKLSAPDDGTVFYANEPDRASTRVGPRIARPPAIEKGTRVREGQVIVFVRDLDGPMRVNAKVPEARVDQVRRGQWARIKVEAEGFPPEGLTGTVENIARGPDPTRFFDSGIKVYTTLVAIDNPPPGCKPGMPAEVEILLKELDNVLTVPIEALVDLEGKPHVAVKGPDGGFVWREVILGAASDTLVEVQQGLKSSDVVALKPRSLPGAPEKLSRGLP